ncbi:hypothetical protein [Porticoccus sp.]
MMHSLKRTCGMLFLGWMGFSAAFALWSLAAQFAWPWLGVLLAASAPLVNHFWPYDRGRSMNMKVRLPLVSLLVMIGVAWVLLTVPERGRPLWLLLGTLGSFLLHTYWAGGDDARH